MFPLPRRRLAVCAVTLLELVTVILVIIILVVILLPVYSQVQRRTDKAACLANLRSLHTAANLYLQEHRMWPQVKSEGVDPEIFAANWVATLKPYGINEKGWVCPTIQRELQNPDLTIPDNARIDYRAMPFDTNPQTPFRWSMPWFVESGDMHGNGNLMIFPDGHEQELGDFKEMLKHH